MNTKSIFIAFSILVVITALGLFLFNRHDAGGVIENCMGIRIVTKVYKNPTNPGKLEQHACIGIFTK